jgi:hypothetical protein
MFAFLHDLYISDSLTSSSDINSLSVLRQGVPPAKDIPHTAMGIMGVISKSNGKSP